MRYRGFGLTAVWVLIGINLLLFVATSIDRDLLLLFGLYPAGFLAQPWTLVTNMFVHAGIWHILANMITLFFFGSFLCRLIGSRDFLITYFAGGILGSILYLLLGDPYTPVVGASGAVYALAGALVVMMPNLRVLVYFIVPMRLWMVILVFFVLWSIPIPGFVSWWAWQAHLGGLVFGLIMGFILRRRGYYYY
jgi:membrane associated rhomboid family serine protease